ncbi:flagella basal body P-ring formation protein FlgA [Devosia crocina]|uniref:Flagella basal body P-ring formation protein FlgA n=1 Tax=Devosia crocina TaxID=429728 RepID=A0A1I7N802_9HYPH|nr:flagellar basal body P-ring formation chaperone FlgA [Devosia crocina]SFV30794.1 flagella basal body P-ring formation protein FlgA [Devosia crocina]
MTLFHKLAMVSAFALTAAGAEAAPVLRGDITVLNTVVTVADMFDEAGALAEKPIFSAPAPGTTGTVDLASIRAAAARVGIVSFEANGLSAINVTRAGATVDERTLTGLILSDLSGRGLMGPGVNATVRFSRFIDPVQVATSGVAVRLDQLRYASGGRDFTARFVLAGQNRVLDLSGTIDMTVDMPHLAANMPAGTILLPEHVVMRPVPASQADAFGYVPLDQLVGMSLNRQSREGMLLRASDISPPLAVSKNELVTIIYRRGPMTLTVKGQAITSASRGAGLQVLNLASKRVITATAVAPGTVEVTSGSVSLAGL